MPPAPVAPRRRLATRQFPTAARSEHQAVGSRRRLESRGGTRPSHRCRHPAPDAARGDVRLRQSRPAAYTADCSPPNQLAPPAPTFRRFRATPPARLHCAAPRCAAPPPRPQAKYQARTPDNAAHEPPAPPQYTRCQCQHPRSPKAAVAPQSSVRLAPPAIRCPDVAPTPAHPPKTPSHKTRAPQPSTPPAPNWRDAAPTPGSGRFGWG